MKRSEMKSLLFDKILNKWDIPWEDFGDPVLNQDEFVDNILSWVEELGMLPPEIQYWNKDENGKLLHNMHNGDYFNRWEQE